MDRHKAGITQHGKYLRVSPTGDPRDLLHEAHD